MGSDNRNTAGESNEETQSVDHLLVLETIASDATIKTWDTIRGEVLVTLSGHLQSITCVRWGGTNLLYSSSQDRNIKVWRPDDGVFCRNLDDHGHWANYLALSTDYVMRTGAFDPANAQIVHKTVERSPEELMQLALARYNSVISVRPETLVSCSDDHTMFLWDPAKSKKSIARLVGHQQTVIQARFSPDGRLIASASFDKSIRVWDSLTGKVLATLRGHTQRVYEVAWSADSRQLCSSSADSTLKLWNMSTLNQGVKNHFLYDLPGHADEVFSVDWSPDGQRCASGGKDKVLKIWR